MLPHHRFLRTVLRHPEALDFHRQYQEITILDITIIVVTQVSLLETMRLLKVLPSLMHRRLALHHNTRHLQILGIIHRHLVPLGLLQVGKALLHNTRHPQALLGIIHRQLDPLVAMVHLLPR